MAVEKVVHVTTHKEGSWPEISSPRQLRRAHEAHDSAINADVVGCLDDCAAALAPSLQSSILSLQALDELRDRKDMGEGQCRRKQF